MSATTIEKPQRQLRADDVLAAILALAARKFPEKRLEVRAHDSDLQRVFRELVGRFDYLQGFFVFSDSGPESYSPALNEAFAKLQLSGLIGRQNPDYQLMVLRPAASDYYDRKLEPSLDEKVKASLQGIADAFVTSVRTQR